MTYDAECKTATVWAEGSRLSAVLMAPNAAPRPRPALLLCHGWGGLKEHLVQLYSEAIVGAAGATADAGAGERPA